jgi:hypothetical protein
MKKNASRLRLKAFFFIYSCKIFCNFSDNCFWLDAERNTMSLICISYSIPGHSIWKRMLWGEAEMHSFSYTNDQVLYNQFSPYFLCRVSWLPIIQKIPHCRNSSQIKWKNRRLLKVYCLLLPSKSTIAIGFTLGNSWCARGTINLLLHSYQSISVE